MQQKVEGQKCEYCDGLIIKSPKTGKLFCEKKCWLNKPGQAPAPVTKSSGGYNNKKTMADFKVMILSYSKDYCVALKLSTDEIFKIADRMVEWFKGKPKDEPKKEQTAVQGEFESPLAEDDIPF